MTRAPIKVLMVDVDGVIIVHPDPKGWSVNLERDLGVSAERLREGFFRPHFGDVIHGRAGLIERLTPVLATLAPKLSVETFVKYWFEQDSHLAYPLLEELAELRAHGLPLHLATVQEHRRADYLWRILGLREHFDVMHYAADLGFAKPAAEFFVKVEARCGFQATDIFFIDDRPDNVDAARARGWNAALWTGERRLAELMFEAGVCAR